MPTFSARRTVTARRPIPRTLAVAARLVCASAVSTVPVLMLSSPAVAQNASEALPDIRVVAPSEAKSGTTEGTRSYTTKSMSTATGLNLSVRETPQAVSVVTRQRLDDQNLLTITDVINNVTGVSGKAFDSSRVFFTARGFNITSLLIDGLPVTWDGAWNGGENLADMAMYDRVEVVRGATGLMNGVGSPSAAINMVRKHATSEVFTGTATLGLGSWNDYRAEVDLSSPLTKDGRVRGRVVGSVQDKDTFRDFEHIRKSTLYAVVDADLTKDTALSVGVSRQENKPKGITWGGLPMWYSDGTEADWDVSKSGAADWTRWYSTQDTYFAGLEQRFDNGWKAKLNYSHVESKANSRLLYIYGSMDKTTGLGLGPSPARYDTTRAQDDVGIQASGPFQLFGRKHEATVGFLHSKQDFDSMARSASGAGAVGNFYEWDASYAEPTWGASSLYETSKVEQNSAYGAVRFSLADPLHLIVGARATDWKGEGRGQWVPIWKNDYNVVTPYAGVVFDVTPEYSVFASYTDIFQPQKSIDLNGRYLDPMTGTTYEAGVKGELLRGKLNGALSAFFTKQRNVAVATGGTALGGPAGMSQPAYEPFDAISKGFEAEVSGQLAAGWDGSVGWSQFRLKSSVGRDVNPNHPRRMLKLFTKYRLPGEMNKLTIGGGVNWESDSYTYRSAISNVRWTQEAFALVNLMARYDFSDAVSAQLNVSNALDKKYGIPNDSYKQLTYGEPRAVALTLKYRF